MEKLANILQDSLKRNKSIVVTLDVNIPKTIIRIHDSRTMYFFGIEKKEELGFTLIISIQKISKKGQTINSELIKDELLKRFMVQEDKKSINYLMNFGQVTSQLLETLEKIISRLYKHRQDEPCSFFVQNIGQMYTLK